jgi:hypothetical protein
LTVSAAAFHPTVLVGMRNRLRASDRPRRLFDDVNTAARAAGLSFAKVMGPPVRQGVGTTCSAQGE